MAPKVVWLVPRAAVVRSGAGDLCRALFGHGGAATGVWWGKEVHTGARDGKRRGETSEWPEGHSEGWKGGL